MLSFQIETVFEKFSEPLDALQPDPGVFEQRFCLIQQIYGVTDFIQSVPGPGEPVIGGAKISIQVDGLLELPLGLFVLPVFKPGNPLFNKRYGRGGGFGLMDLYVIVTRLFGDDGDGPFVG